MRFWLILGVVVSVLTVGGPAQTPKAEAPPESRYEYRDGTPDGIGKWYMGREIAHFMSHLGAPWLERPEREEEERPTRLVEALNLKPGDSVADIGAGSGYLSWRMARQVSPGGRVFATDIQPEMLAIMATNMQTQGITNVVPVLGSITNSGLKPRSVDLAIMVDVYHEFDHPFEMMQSMVASLRPGGRIVFVEYRGEDKWVPIKPLHKMTEAQVRKEMSIHPMEWVEFFGSCRGNM